MKISKFIIFELSRIILMFSLSFSAGESFGQGDVSTALTCLVTIIYLIAIGFYFRNFNKV